MFHAYAQKNISLKKGNFIGTYQTLYPLNKFYDIISHAEMNEKQSSCWHKSELCKHLVRHKLDRTKETSWQMFVLCRFCYTSSFCLVEAG
jgi:hypothetical protein